MKFNTIFKNQKGQKLLDVGLNLIGSSPVGESNKIVNSLVKEGMTLF